MLMSIKLPRHIFAAQGYFRGAGVVGF